MICEPLSPGKPGGDARVCKCVLHVGDRGRGGGAPARPKSHHSLSSFDLELCGERLPVAPCEVHVAALPRVKGKMQDDPAGIFLETTKDSGDTSGTTRKIQMKICCISLPECMRRQQLLQVAASQVWLHCSLTRDCPALLSRVTWSNDSHYSENTTRTSHYKYS